MTLRPRSGFGRCGHHADATSHAHRVAHDVGSRDTRGSARRVGRGWSGCRSSSSCRRHSARAVRRTLPCRMERSSADERDDRARSLRRLPRGVRRKHPALRGPGVPARRRPFGVRGSRWRSTSATIYMEQGVGSQAGGVPRSMACAHVARPVRRPAFAVRRSNGYPLEHPLLTTRVMRRLIALLRPWPRRAHTNRPHGLRRVARAAQDRRVARVPDRPASDSWSRSC